MTMLDRNEQSFSCSSIRLIWYDLVSFNYQDFFKEGEEWTK